jgi:hypothetical protein
MKACLIVQLAKVAHNFSTLYNIVGSATMLSEYRDVAGVGEDFG